MAKSNLPNNSLTNDNLTAEAIHLTTLYNTKPRSSSGQASFISSTSGFTYTTLGSDFDNQGQEGLLQVLQLALDSYLVTADDYNGITDSITQVTDDLITHSNNTSNPHAVTAVQIDAIPLTQKGVANGVATLNSSGYPVEKTYVTGSYTGDGLASRNIVLGFQPSAVFVMLSYGIRHVNAYDYDSGLAIAEYPAQANSDVGLKTLVAVISTGFNVGHYTFFSGTTYVISNNQNTIRYNYIAFR